MRRPRMQVRLLTVAWISGRAVLNTGLQTPHLLGVQEPILSPICLLHTPITSLLMCSSFNVCKSLMSPTFFGIPEHQRSDNKDSTELSGQVK